jgi:hypothetical protein
LDGGTATPTLIIDGNTIASNVTYEITNAALLPQGAPSFNTSTGVLTVSTNSTYAGGSFTVTATYGTIKAYQNILIRENNYYIFDLGKFGTGRTYTELTGANLISAG